jgi:hypothetical protein
MKSRKYDTALSGAPVLITRKINTRAPTVQSDVAVPALMGLILGLVAAILPALVLGALAGGFFWTAFLGFASVFSAYAIYWRLDVIDGSLFATEEIEGIPPAAGQLEMPALPAPQTPVLLNPYNGRQALASEKRQEEDEGFRAYVQGCEADTTLRKWEPLIGRGQYQRWRDLLIESGWAAWKSDNQRDGWELSAAPGVIIEALDA